MFCCCQRSMNPSVPIAQLMTQKDRKKAALGYLKAYPSVRNNSDLESLDFNRGCAISLSLCCPLCLPCFCIGMRNKNNAIINEVIRRADDERVKVKVNRRHHFVKMDFDPVAAPRPRLTGS